MRRLAWRNELMRRGMMQRNSAPKIGLLVAAARMLGARYGAAKHKLLGDEWRRRRVLPIQLPPPPTNSMNYLALPL